MERDQQRKNKRSTVSGFSCTAGAELTPLKSPTGRPGVDCDPIPAAPVPFTPVTPDSCPPALPVPLNLPPGLVVVNDLATAFCPSTAGYSVTGTTASTVVTGAQQSIVLFTALENITNNQLNYLSEVVPTSSTAIIAAALSGATNSVISLTHLNYAQSEELIITIQDAKFTVNTLAVEQARNLLICQVENDLQFATCPTSAYFGPSAAVPSGLLYTPSATAATGSFLVNFALTPTSGNQAAFTLINIPSLTAAAAQANSLALTQAASELRCVFGNAATAAACCATGSPGNNLGFTYCVPTTGPTIEGSATAVGYFSVSANTVFSAVSATEANSVARELSRNSLNCYFPSTGITATCVGLGLTAPFAAASTTSVFLPAGSIILYGTADSVTAANEQATTIATASLNCFWSNTLQTTFCPPSGTFTAINNQLYNLAASTAASIHYSSSVTAGLVISYTSQAAANEQALQLALANISCSYCNNAIPPTCTGGVNATIGTLPDIICNVSASVAQNTAVSLGNILVTTSEGGLNCCYGNEEVINTVVCGPSAYRNPGSNFTSADSFFIPANVITICASTTAPPTPPLLFSYSNVFATNVAQVGCCSDILLCGGLTGSLTALPAIWSYTSNLFDVIELGATFYTDEEGVTPYPFPAGYTYLVSRDVTPRGYRAITGGTGYTLGLTSCADCGNNYTSYLVKGATAGAYSSALAASVDMFCDGPTAQPLTLYTSTTNILNEASYWYTDECGLSAFNPVTGASATGHYFIGYISGATGYLLEFADTGSNEANLNISYNPSSCPLSAHPYTVYLGAACSTAAGATTLYGALPAPDLFTSYSGTAYFYTSLFNDASIYSTTSASYINYVAPDLTVYSRPISGVTATAPFTCSTLYKTTVQWSNVTPDDVCNYPNFYSPTADGVFNTNIRTLWCDVDTPFVSGATAKFYTQPASLTALEFKPGVSGPVYLSQFTPGDTFRTAYRQYAWSNTDSTLKSYTGTFKASPFIQSATGIGGTAVWLHSATAFFMDTTEVSGRARTKELMAMPASATCAKPAVYSDIKFALTSNTALSSTYKILPYPPPVARDLYSSYLLFDGIGYNLSNATSGVLNATTITLNDLTKVGAGFTGAIISTNATGINDIGRRPYPAYIAGINETSGVITIGGYYNRVNTAFTNRPLYVTGFKIETGGWSSTGPSFQCYGPHCNKLEVGHSIFSYKIGVSWSTGFVTRIVGSTVYYSAAPGFDNFLSSYSGTGASDGSGHVYVQGRQFARFWTDENKQTPVFSNLYSNTYNYIWKQASATADFTTAKNLVLGNTAGSTAQFVVAGANYTYLDNNVPRPYSYTGGIEWSTSLNAFVLPQYSYSCTGAVTSSLTPQFPQDIGYVDSCCDVIQVADPDTYGSLAVAACIYYETYEFSQPYGEIPEPAYRGLLHYVAVNDTYYDVTTHEPLNSNYVIDPNTGNAFSNGKFTNAMFVDGKLNLSYPCSATQIWDAETNTIWMRKYIGFFSVDPMLVEEPSYPTDTTYPGGFLLDNPAYWSGPGKSNTAFGATSGYVFKDYVPATASAIGCNCGNFSHIDYSPTSGNRYSIWTSDAAAWTATVAGSYYMPEMLIAYSNDPILNFNDCTTACSEGFTCASPADCDGVTFGLFSSSFDSEVIEFDPTEYDIPSIFSFGDSPLLEGPALKEEATDLAQTLVNSFVNCYYFNDFTAAGGGTCDEAAGEITLSGGGVSIPAGTVVSQISKKNANQIALNMARGSGAVCLPGYLGGTGCVGTTISDTIVDTDIATIELRFQKSVCSFIPTLEYVSKTIFKTATLKKIKICTANGSEEIYVPDFGLDGSVKFVTGI